MAQRLLRLISLVLLWLVVANGTCDMKRRQGELIDSYQVARYELTECQDMGGDRLDPDSLEEALRLSEDIEEMLTRKNWSRASKTIPELQRVVALLLDRLKAWDPDGDGLSNYAEFMLHGTLWADSDSDGDGYLDGSEILHHRTDPLDYCGVPIGEVPETVVVQPCPALEKLRQSE
jgi:hypothetical protein